MDEFIKKLDKTILFFVIYSVCFIVFFGTLNYTLPFVLALICALIIKRPTLYIMKKFKLKNGTASLIMTIIFFTIVLSLMTWGITSLTQEAIQLGKNIQEYFSKADYSNMNNFYNKLNTYYKNLDPSIVKSIENNITNITSKISAFTVSASSKILKAFVNFLTSIPYLIMLIIFTLLATYFFTRDMTSTQKTFNNFLPRNKSDKIFYIYNESKKMIGNYLVSYMIIIGITFIETLIVFIIFRIKYAVILSILAAIFDILPVVGISAVYIPLAIFYFFSKGYVQAFGLVISFAVVSIVRQLIEPKIVSSSLGIHPVAVLAAIFIGLKANGISGMFFCIFLVVFYNILKKVNVL